MEGTIGEIRLFAGNFAPKYWAYCNGAILAIQTNTALFSILGTTFGGNGTTTFGLPDFRGRVAVGTGQGPGLSSYSLGQMSGTETNTLLIANLPTHNHTVPVSGGIKASSTNGAAPAASTTNSTLGAAIDSSGSGTVALYNNLTPDITLNTGTPANATGFTGSGLPVNNIQPYLAMNYVICLVGVYPSRS